LRNSSQAEGTTVVAAKQLRVGVVACSGTEMLQFATNPDLPESTVFHVAANPDIVVLPSEVKSTCKYPVDDVYTSSTLVPEPDSRAICSVELHDDDVQQLMVT
jgi:hypothetical protein